MLLKKTLMKTISRDESYEVHSHYDLSITTLSYCLDVNLRISCYFGLTSEFEGVKSILQDPKLRSNDMLANYWIKILTISPIRIFSNIDCICKLNKLSWFLWKLGFYTNIGTKWTYIQCVCSQWSSLHECRT